MAAVRKKVQIERKIRTPRDAKGLGHILTRPRTTYDIVFSRVPPRTTRNIKGSHMLGGIRDIQRMTKSPWEKEVAEATRVMDEQRFYKASRVYLALDASSRALSEAEDARQKAQKMGEELQTANEEMQATSEEMEASNEELKATNEEMERSRDDLEQFAYVVSHDLQEPLREVASYTELLANRYKPKLGKEAEEFIGFILSGTGRMQQLISDLLTFARVGTQGKPFEGTDCEDVLNRALTNLRIAIEESKAKLTHDALPAVMGDGTQLTQLFQNLIGNAIKFRDKKAPKIHVSAKREGTYWEFSVRDEGIGIDPEYKKRIFGIFQRLHTHSEYPGTGVGLSICKKVVERHGGRIRVESELSKGSTFYFTIPAIKEADDKRPDRVAAKRRSKSEQQKRKDGNHEKASEHKTNRNAAV